MSSTSFRTAGADEKIQLNDCRKIYVQRDYSLGLDVRFDSVKPPELQPYITDDEWTTFMEDLNGAYARAEEVNCRSACETVFACFTCYASNICVTTQYDKQLRVIHDLLERHNANVFVPRHIFVTDPVQRGLRVIEISFLREVAVQQGQQEANTQQYVHANQCPPNDYPRSPIMPANLLGNRS